MKKNRLSYFKLVGALTLSLCAFTACSEKPQEPSQNVEQETRQDVENATPSESNQNITEISLKDDEITVDGKAVGADTNSAVYIANDIIYYEAGKDFTYGEGMERDAHSVEEAADNTVIHITKPGTYSISGTLSKGQIAVDLGEGAEENPEAVVTLIMNGVDITCEVAPAVIFYNVYECGDTDTEAATMDVDTSKAGANVIVADGTTNTVNGSYVEKIYKPDSVVLNADKTEVEDADKLHKYDGAFYSKMSMNIDGGDEGTGILNINADNEGLDSELHLTINGGNININSGNDGINTNEDGVSVTTVNAGTLTINVTGETGEGDGIDSNGWLVINGGKVIASACSNSADAGIDSDMGIHINGGTVIASGHMLDRIEDGGQTYAVFNFAQEQSGEDRLALKNEEGEDILSVCPQNSYSILLYSSPDMNPGTYTLWSNDMQLAGQGGGMTGGPGMQGMNPEGMTPPEDMENMEPPVGGEAPEGMERPEGMEPPAGGQPPEGMESQQGERPVDGKEPLERPDEISGESTQESTTEFQMNQGANMFNGII